MPPHTMNHVNINITSNGANPVQYALSQTSKPQTAKPEPKADTLLEIQLMLARDRSIFFRWDDQVVLTGNVFMPYQEADGSPAGMRKSGVKHVVIAYPNSMGFIVRRIYHVRDLELFIKATNPKTRKTYQWGFLLPMAALNKWELA